MFYRDGAATYRATQLDNLDWLVHGFGTRSADIPTRFPHLATLKQTHSTVCIVAAARSGVLGEGDALLENRAGAVVAVRTADCVPVLLVDERLRAVAAVHSGWRGTVAGIVPRAMESMQAAFGTCPSDLHAAIGPAIGPCCYEVGAEVACHFGLAGKGNIDLESAIADQLASAGLAASRIYRSGLCTRCLAADFHSYRRDGEAAGRLHSFAGIRA
jgi:polyphenol oxidase